MDYDTKVRNRLSRIEGQIRGVQKMIDEEKNCKDVVTQLSAVRSAVDRVIALVVASNLEACVREEMNNGGTSQQTIQEAVDLLMKGR